MNLPDAGKMGISRTFYFYRLWWAVGFLMLVAIIAGSLSRMPSTDIPLPANFDKWQHVFCYGVLMVWYAMLLHRRRHAFVAAISFFLFSAFIEYLQGLGGYRSRDWADLTANSIGLGIGLAWFFSPWANVLQRFDARLSASHRAR